MNDEASSAKNSTVRFWQRLVQGRLWDGGVLVLALLSVVRITGPVVVPRVN